MNEEDKATTTIPQSPSQQLLAKVDRRDKLVRIVEITILMAVVVLNIFIGLRIQTVIDSNNKATVQARQDNVERTTQSQQYIKCIVLLRFNTTPMALQTKAGVEKALDACAAEQN